MIFHYDPCALFRARSGSWQSRQRNLPVVYRSWKSQLASHEQTYSYCLFSVKHIKTPIVKTNCQHNIYFSQSFCCCQKDQPLLNWLPQVETGTVVSNRSFKQLQSYLHQQSRDAKVILFCSFNEVRVGLLVQLIKLMLYKKNFKQQNKIALQII